MEGIPILAIPSDGAEERVLDQKWNLDDGLSPMSRKMIGNRFGLMIDIPKHSPRAMAHISAGIKWNTMRTKNLVLNDTHCWQCPSGCGKSIRRSKHKSIEAHCLSCEKLCDKLKLCTVSESKAKNTKNAKQCPDGGSSRAAGKRLGFRTPQFTSSRPDPFHRKLPPVELKGTPSTDINPTSVIRNIQSLYAESTTRRRRVTSNRFLDSHSAYPTELAREGFRATSF
ncbi:hypothetical protein AAMO2058_000545600 [Amorphochlora amoebiformis]|mmetsp:Transcript_26057/g.41265  ORF Transcript_26057/g.41265 Transcript_26057/m.41265 type:complete len:226 (-) Transcript_26057:342-1019(-)